jgi:hypothetical protein
MSDNEIKTCLRIRTGVKEDVPLILEFVRGIAEFKSLLHLISAAEETLAEFMFGNKPYAEVFLPSWKGCL